MIASTVYVMSLRRPAEAEVSEDRQPSRWSRIAGNLLDRVESATEAHSDADDARRRGEPRLDHEAAQPVDRPVRGTRLRVSRPRWLSLWITARRLWFSRWDHG